MRLRIALWTAAVMFSGVLPLGAQVSDHKLATLLVWHRGAGGVVVEGDGRKRGAIAKDEHFYMRKNETLNIVVLDANPFLFTYSSAKGETTASPNDTNTAAFLKAASSLIGTLPVAGQGAPAIGLIEGLKLGDFRADIAEVSRQMDGLPGLFDASLQVMGDSEAAYASAVSKFKEDKLSGWQALITRTGKNVTLLENISAKCATNPAAPLTTDADVARPQTCEDVSSILNPLANYKDTLVSRLAVLQDVYNDAQKMSPFRADAVEFQRGDTSMVVEVKANTKYADFLSGSAKKAQSAGSTKMTVPLRAYTNWIISPGPAVVYSYVRNPTFSTVFENGKFRVVETPGKASAYSAGAIINIQHRRWVDPTLEFLLQAGITPTKDQMGVMGGFGIVLMDTLTFGGGYMRQQVRRRTDGGGPILDTPDQLKTDTKHWAQGAYLILTYKK